jgi:superfamily II DNA/RNA helicase
LHDDNATWEELGVEPARIESFRGLVPPWDKPTHVQAKTIPSLLQGHDYIVQAPAGQGKTGAFLITTVALLARSPGPGPHVVIVTAGGELVDQLKQDIERLDNTVRLCRVKQEPSDMAEAKRMPHGYADYPVLAASVGKLANLLGRSERGLLKNVKLFVADEADKLLSDYTVEFRGIVSRLPRDCQRTFWSATIDDRTESELRNMTRNPRSTLAQRLDPKALLTRNCANYVVSVPSDDAGAKYAVLELISKFSGFQQMLVFANKPNEAKYIVNQLRALGCSADAMHGKDDGIDRENTLTKFRNKEVTVLIATDILSRGLDCADLNCVVNWGTPRL